MKMICYVVIIPIIIIGVYGCYVGYVICDETIKKSMAERQVRKMLEEIKMDNFQKAFNYWKNKTKDQPSNFKEFLMIGHIEKINSYKIVGAEYCSLGVIVYAKIANKDIPKNFKNIPFAFWIEKGTSIGYSAHNKYIEAGP